MEFEEFNDGFDDGMAAVEKPLENQPPAPEIPLPEDLEEFETYEDIEDWNGVTKEPKTKAPEAPNAAAKPGEKNIFGEEVEKKAEEAAKIPFKLSDFLEKQLGSSKIMTGSKENPLEYDLTDLTEQQQIALLMDITRKKTLEEVQKGAGSEEVIDLSDEEFDIIAKIRAGNAQEIIDMLSEESGGSATSEFTDDDYMAWRIKVDNPDLTEEEVIAEVQVAKDLPSYSKKVTAAKAAYEKAAEEYTTTLEKQAAQEREEEWKANAKTIVDMAVAKTELYGFDLEDEDGKAVVKEAVKDLLEIDDQMQTTFNKILNDNEQVLELAMLRRAMPRIQKYVAELEAKEQELETLKSTLSKSTSASAQTPPPNASVLIKKDSPNKKQNDYLDNLFLESRLQPFEEK